MVHGDKPGPAGQLFDLSFEFTEGFVRPAYLGSTESEAKKDDLICRDDTALVLIDPEFEGTFQETFEAFHDPFSRSTVLHQNDEVSSPGESHPQALSEPDVNLSAHPAPIIQPQAQSPSSSGQKVAVRVLRPSPANILPAGDGE